MRNRVIFVLTLALLAAAPLAAQGIRNFLRVNEKICTGGQPTMEQLEELKSGGVRAILNLRRPSEYDAAAEEAKARALGLRYFNIAVEPEAPTDAQVEEFLKILADSQNRPIFIHCGSANRVGAFWMIRRVLVDEWSLADAEAEAKRIGLSNEKTRAFALDYLRRHEGR